MVFFDSTGPHRGPGVAAGESGEREVLYLSWALATVERSKGIPFFAHRPERGREGEDWGLAFNDAGEYQIDRRAPRTVGAEAKAGAQAEAAARALMAAGGSRG